MFANAQAMFMNDPHSPDLKSKVKEFRKTANFLLEAERQFYQQKLKNKHLLFADRGTSYFHTMLKKKNFASSIPTLIKADGSSTCFQKEVIQEFLTFFENLLCFESPVVDISPNIISQRPKLFDEDYILLSSSIDDASIREALFNIRDDKAPGPDGYTATFFKTNWDTIKVDFLNAVHEFFRNGRLLTQFNHTAIALIPKVKHAPQAKDFRPISCCNVIYKTITKVIASKLAVVIPNIIDPAQSVFLEERLMSDNILLAQHLLRNYGRKTSTPRCMMMVDIKKAFDSVSWEFMINLLHHLVFQIL